MKKSTLALVVGGLALIPGIVIGYFVGSRSLGIRFNPLVVVGPDAGTLMPKEDVTLHYDKQDQMTWRSDNGRALVISFPDAKFPKEAGGIEPFADMTHSPSGPYGSEWVFKHPFGSNVAVSPKINPALEKILKSGAALKYGYAQTLGGTPADGRIIIMK